jgi:PAS domain S-box-containing protein
LLDFVHPDDVNSTLDAVAALASQKEVVNFVNRYRCRDGAYRWIEWRSVSAGNLIYAAARDITERKRTESALELSERKYRMLYDSAIDAIFIADVDGKFIDVNRTAHERLGYTRDELLALHISRLDPPDFAAKAGARIEQLRHQGRLIFETAHRRKDGTIMPVEINARIIDYDHRKAIFSIVRDITDRKLAEQEREKLIAELQNALAEIKTLHGILPICASCKKIRDDQGAWHQVEAYIRDHTDAEFSHGLCADCAKKLYPGFAQGEE